LQKGTETPKGFVARFVSLRDAAPDGKNPERTPIMHPSIFTTTSDSLLNMRDFIPTEIVLFGVKNHRRLAALGGVFFSLRLRALRTWAKLERALNGAPSRSFIVQAVIPAVDPFRNWRRPRFFVQYG
jgi:hypothetical protein